MALSGWSPDFSASFGPDDDEAPTPRAPWALSTAPGASSDPAGSVLADLPGYQILGELGKGGMGRVYRARHLALGRIVALKILRAGEEADEEERSRFHQEAEVIARLLHPNIVQLFEIGEREGRDGGGPLPWMSMEFCSGGSLARRLRAGPLPPREAAILLVSLARATRAAHECRILHRDLKPANILFDDSNTPKIADFGLAKRLDDQSRTRTGVAMGTPGYMAPEQARGDRDLGPAVDIHALGAILYECLTGRPPFLGETHTATINLVLTREPLAPRLLQPGIPLDLETICLTCLHKEPARRYPSAAALADDVDRFLDNRPILARPVGTCERIVKWLKRRPAVSGLMLLLVVVTVAGLTGILFALREAVQRGERETAARERAFVAVEQRNDALKVAESALNGALRDGYFSRMALAWTEYQSGQIERCQQLLSNCPLDHAGWEARHLNALCSQHRSAFHPNAWVERIAVRPDGSRIAAGVGRGHVRLWELPGGKESILLPTGNSRVLGLAFSPDGTRLAACGVSQNFDKPGKVVVWDLARPEEPFYLPGPTLGLRALKFDPTGKYLLYGGGDTATKQGQSFCYDLEGKRLVWSHTDEPGPVRHLEVHPNGKEVVIGTGPIRFRNLATGALLRTLDALHGLTAFSPDGSLLAGLVPDGGEVRVMNMTGPMPILLRSRVFPRGPVFALAWHPDGDRLAVACNEPVVRLWNPRSGEVERIWRGHRLAVNDVAFLPTPHRHPLLLTASGDGWIKSWDVAGLSDGAIAFKVPESVRAFAVAPDGRLVFATDDSLLWSDRDSDTVVKEESPPAERLAFSPGGDRLAVLERSGDLRIRSVPVLGDQSATLSVSPSDPISRTTVLAWHPGGDRIATGEASGAIRLRDGRTGAILRTLAGHTRPITALVFDPNGETLTSADGDQPEAHGTLKRWNTASGSEIPLELPPVRGNVTALAISPDGRTLAASFRSWQRATTFVWQLDQQKLRLLHDLGGYSSPLFDLVPSPDGRRLVTVGADGSIRIWGLLGGEPTGVVGTPPSPRQVAFSPDGYRLLVLTAKGKCARYEGSSALPVFWSGVNAWNAAPAPKENAFAVCDATGLVEVREPATGRTRFRLREHKGPVRRVAFRRDGSLLASAGFDGMVKLWDPKTGEARGSIAAHDGVVEDIAFTRDGSTLYTIGKDGRLRLWEVPSGQEKTEWSRTKEGRYRMILSPDESRVVTTGADRRVRVYESATGKEIAVLGGNEQPVSGIGFSRDGKRLATVDWNGTVQVFNDAYEQEATRKLARGAGALEFAPDGKTLLVGDNTGRLLVLDLETLQTLRVHRGHDAGVRSLAIGSDGKTLLSCGHDGRVLLWDLSRPGDPSGFSEQVR